MSLPSFFDFFVVGEIWSAMDLSARDKREAAVSRHLSCCAPYPWVSCISEVSHSLYHLVISLSAKSTKKHILLSTILLNVFPYANVKTMEDFPYILIRFYVDFFSNFRGLLKLNLSISRLFFVCIAFTNNM